MKKELLKNVLYLMNQKQIPLYKIYIQKIVFYLKQTGILLNYKYEPYTYGPYSFELKSDLSELVMCDELELKGNMYTINKEVFKHNNKIPQIEIEKISNKMNEYYDALDGDISFPKMELSGTIIYCIKALKQFGRKIDEDIVVKEFKNWKGDKYNDNEIKLIYKKINPLLN